MMERMVQKRFLVFILRTLHIRVPKLRTLFIKQLYLGAIKRVWFGRELFFPFFPRRSIIVFAHERERERERESSHEGDKRREREREREENTEMRSNVIARCEN